MSVPTPSDLEPSSTQETQLMAIRGLLPLVSVVACYAVFFLWGFWDRGVDALGVNTTIFWIGVCYALALLTPTKRPFSSENLLWSVPVTAIALSYMIFDNYFIKGVNFLAMPLILGSLFMHSRTLDLHRWSFSYLTELLTKSSLVLLAPMARALGVYYRWLARIIPGGNSIGRRVLSGIAIFAVLSVGIVVPLLGGAEPLFGQYVNAFYSWLTEVLALDSILGRCVVFIVIVNWLLCAALLWPAVMPQRHDIEKTLDSIVGGIVLGGVLLLYLAFLAIQFQRLFIGVLPIEFHETETLVKTGFWQLLALSLMNIALVITFAQRTVALVQKILQLFSIASLLLLASAAYRMALYVRFYGFSYEKFFASYTVLYCAILFAYLIVCTLSSKRRDPIRFGALLFVGMYSTISLMPTERFIVEANIVLSKLPGARLALSDMRMLSPDVLGVLEDYYQAGKLPLISSPAGKYRGCGYAYTWSDWIDKRRREIRRKALFEYNIGNAIYALTHAKQLQRVNLEQECSFDD